MNDQQVVTQDNPTDKPVRILILQRGWVFVGYYSATADEVRLDKAQNIRRWGTTKGLGELGEKGPRPETRLDPHGVVRCHPLTVIATVDCEADKWTAALS